MMFGMLHRSINLGVTLNGDEISELFDSTIFGFVQSDIRGNIKVHTIIFHLDFPLTK